MQAGSAAQHGVRNLSCSLTTPEAQSIIPSSHRKGSHGAAFRAQQPGPARMRSQRKAMTVHGAKTLAEPLLSAPVVAVEVETGPANSRRLYAGIDIMAPWSAVWSALTDYDGLADFIPGLAENKCLSRSGSGARLLQIGEQSLAMGLTFRARVVLDIEEHPTGVASQQIDDSAVDQGRFPLPRSPLAKQQPRDICFQLAEGDFQAFRGIWRVQEVDEPSAGEAATRLSYALFVRPQKWLPVALIQTRIESEIVSNLRAVRNYAEQQWLSSCTS